MDTSKKIKTLPELATIIRDLKEKERLSVGLITACFDVLHYRHLEFFEFAKQHVDILTVGIENDKTIRCSKGPQRPVFPQKIRVKMVAALEVVDYVFIIEDVVDYRNPQAKQTYVEITRILGPTAIISASQQDQFWREKQQRAEMFGIRFINDDRPTSTTSSQIIRILESLG